MSVLDETDYPAWDRLQKQLTDLRAENKELQARLTKIDADRNRLEALRIENEGRIEELTRKGENLCCETGTLLMELSTLKEENERLKKQLRDARMICGNMEKSPVLCEGEWKTGMFCGLEDADITDRYDACMYGYKQALERVQEWVMVDIENALTQQEKKEVNG